MAPAIPVIDCDAHVVEPRDLWTSRVVGFEAVEIPQVRYNEEKAREEWFVGGTFHTRAPAGAPAGLPVPSVPATYEEALPAAIDSRRRLALMDEQGIYAQVLYPNVAGFGNGGFLKLRDQRLRLACVQAYNDFLVEFAEVAPERFVPVCALPFWDLQASIAEVARAADIGHRAVLFTGKPDVWWEQPHIADPYWEPLWGAIEERGLSISFHAGGGDPEREWKHHGYKGMPRATRFTANSVPVFFGHAQTIVDLIFGGVAERHPGLEFVIVESGVGWVPFLLECMDYQFDENGVASSSPELTLRPSEYFKRQFYTSFWFERIAPSKLLDDAGRQRVMFETDFPHPTSLWPTSTVRDQIEFVQSVVDEETARLVLWENAARLYGVSLPGAGD